MMLTILLAAAVVPGKWREHVLRVGPGNGQRKWRV